MLVYMDCWNLANDVLCKFLSRNTLPNYCLLLPYIFLSVYILFCFVLLLSWVVLRLFNNALTHTATNEENDKSRHGKKENCYFVRSEHKHQKSDTSVLVKCLIEWRTNSSGGNSKNKKKENKGTKRIFHYKIDPNNLNKKKHKIHT